jgi:cell wall-associated NlpC family hydrolase
VTGALILSAALLSIALLLGGCAGRGGAVPQPFPTPGGGRATPRAVPDGAPDAGGAGGPATRGIPSPPVPPASVLVQSLVATALHLVGTPYRNGGAGPDGFDCSGFVHYVFAQQGVFVPRTAADQAGAGQRVGELRAGDLVFFRTSGRGPTHVGIALDADRFIHAPSARGEVRVEALAQPYWADRFVEARRVF